MTLFKHKCTYASDGTNAGTIKCDGMAQGYPSNGPACLAKQDSNNDLKCIGLWVIIIRRGCVYGDYKLVVSWWNFSG